MGDAGFRHSWPGPGCRERQLQRLRQSPLELGRASRGKKLALAAASCPAQPPWDCVCDGGNGGSGSRAAPTFALRDENVTVSLLVLSSELKVPRILVS
jgi:hypothetical protein